ncbi:MAG: PaaI family thioesterase [Actinobacteria bacterium]|nr:PaaI family thioesterase [Actinomycetota bacterium]
MDEVSPGPGLDERQLEELTERVRNSPFHAWAGMELVEVGQGRAEVTMTLRDHHFNPQRIVHGGIISAMADTSIGLALRSMLPAGMTHRTAQLDVHFLAKGEGDRLVGRGRSLHLGQRMGYGEAEVYDGGGRLLARASATFIVLPAPGAF